MAFLSVMIFEWFFFPFFSAFLCTVDVFERKKMFQLKLCAAVTIPPQFVSVIWIYILGNPEGKHQSSGSDGVRLQLVCNCTLLICETDCKHAGCWAANVSNTVRTKCVSYFSVFNLFYMLLVKTVAQVYDAKVDGREKWELLGHFLCLLI